MKKQNFEQILKEFPEDYEKYINLKDEILINRKLDSVQICCFGCNRSGHIFTECPLIFYQNQKSIIFRKLKEKINKNMKEYKRKRDKEHVFELLEKVNEDAEDI